MENNDKILQTGYAVAPFTPPLGLNIPGYFEPTDEWNREFSNDRIWS